MNESLLNNMTSQELINQFEYGDIPDNLLRVFIRNIISKTEPIEKEDLSAELAGVEAELDDTNERVGELVDTIREALEMNDIDDLKDHLKGAL